MRQYQEQIRQWEKLYHHPLSRMEYEGICQSLGDFFNLLKKWDDVEKMENEKNEKHLPYSRP